MKTLYLCVLYTCIYNCVSVDKHPFQDFVHTRIFSTILIKLWGEKRKGYWFSFSRLQRRSINYMKSNTRQNLNFWRTLGFKGVDAKTSIPCQLPLGNSSHRGFQICCAALKVLSWTALFDLQMREPGSKEAAELLPQVWQRPALCLRPPGSSLRNETKHSACTTKGRWKTSGHILKPAEEAGQGAISGLPPAAPCLRRPVRGRPRHRGARGYSSPHTP